jgi:Predicted membrane protein (DUF2207) N-terminal domain/Predicted membrane protein (DUF2207) C-terminal domain
MSASSPLVARMHLMRARRGLCWCAIVLALLLGAGSAHAAEVIHSFVSYVQVAKDGELTVTETIRVRAEGRSMRHGIYRDFPLAFKDSAGSLHEVTFSILGVSRDGKPERYHTQHQRGFIRIYAGSKKALVNRGDHTYEFRYLTGRQVRWFDGKPELNWNVTGNFWNFPIIEATYYLQLAGHARPRRWTAFTGRRGAHGTAWRGAIGDDGALTVSTTQPLAPGEGLTVVAELPGGAVEPPSQSTLLWYQFLDNRRWIFASVGFIVVLGYYFAAWSAVGRDPRPGTIIPLFHPPAGISPALANYIHDWGFRRDKWRAFTAACLSLAVRGLVRFGHFADTLTLEATGKQSEDNFDSLPPGEGAIVTWLQSHGGTVTIDRSNGTAVAKVGSSFTKSIERENRNKFFRRNLGYVVIGLIMTGLVVFGIAMLGGLNTDEFAILFTIAFGGFWLGVFLVPILMSMFQASGFVRVVRIAVSLVFIGVLSSFALTIARGIFPSGFSTAVPVVSAFISNYPFPFVLVASFTTLNGLFLYLMRAPTALGRPVMDQLSGFRLYLETAEAYRLNAQAPEITAERFEALLPYAVALDVEKPWAQAFEVALRRAHPGDADPMRHYHPTWTSGGSGWSSSDFSSAVASTVGGVSSALASAVPVSSGSSGFSGGGGSGGGGGGGGGGGW